MDVTRPIMKFSGSSTQVQKVIDGVKNGSIKGLITAGVNPLYAFPDADFAAAYQGLDFTLAFAMRADETASKARFVAATPHYLESWGDAELKKGHFSLIQPTIRPLFDTRQFQDCLLAWTGVQLPLSRYIKGYWQAMCSAVLRGVKPYTTGCLPVISAQTTGHFQRQEPLQDILIRVMLWPYVCIQKLD